MVTLTFVKALPMELEYVPSYYNLRFSPSTEQIRSKNYPQ